MKFSLRRRCRSWRASRAAAMRCTTVWGGALWELVDAALDAVAAGVPAAAGSDGESCRSGRSEISGVWGEGAVVGFPRITAIHFVQPTDEAAGEMERGREMRGVVQVG